MNKTSEKQVRAVAYARFSSDMQRNESIDAQLRAINAYARQNNYSILSVFVDKAQSATTDKRIEFQKMIKESQNNKFDVIIVHKFDRFSRDRYDSIFYKRMLRSRSIRVLSVIEKIEDTPEGIIMESVLEAFNEFYSRNLARETMKGLKENALKCKHTGGIPPLGFDLDANKKLIINESEEHIVQIIFDMYVEDKSYVKIINYLNDNNLKTKAGKNFGKNSIHSILSNQKYNGTFIYNKTVARSLGKRNSHSFKSEEEIIKITNGCPTIIETEKFTKAQEKLKSRKQVKKYRLNEEFIFTGRISCLECGSTFCGINKRRSKEDKKIYSYYGCTKCNYTKVCDNKLILADMVEGNINNYIREYINSKTNFDEIIHTQMSIIEDAKNNQDFLRGNLDIINKKIDTLLELVIEYKNPVYSDKIDSLAHEKYTLENQIFCFNDIEISTFKKKLIKKLNLLKSLERKVFNENNIKKIGVGKTEILVEVFIFEEFTFNFKVDRDLVCGFDN